MVDLLLILISAIWLATVTLLIAVCRAAAHGDEARPPELLLAERLRSQRDGAAEAERAGAAGRWAGALPSSASWSGGLALGAAARPPMLSVCAGATPTRPAWKSSTSASRSRSAAPPAPVVST